VILRENAILITLRDIQIYHTLLDWMIYQILTIDVLDIAVIIPAILTTVKTNPVITGIGKFQQGFSRIDLSTTEDTLYTSPDRAS